MDALHNLFKERSSVRRHFDAREGMVGLVERLQRGVDLAGLCYVSWPHSVTSLAVCVIQSRIASFTPEVTP